MNCREVAKFIYAFADGELDTEQNLQVLEHLNVCPTCARKVNLQSELRGRLSDLESGVTAPASLRAGVLAAIAAERAGTTADAPARAPRKSSSPAKGGAKRPVADKPAIWRRQWLQALALAAVIGLAFVSMYRTMAPTKPKPGTVGSVAHVTDTSPAAVRLANYVEKLHEGCAGEGVAHHDPNLGSAGDVDAVVATLSDRLGVPVLRMPHACGFPIAFESAHICQMQDSGGAFHDAAHLIYRRKDGQDLALSLISLPAMPEVRMLKHCSTNHCTILKPIDADEKAPMSVLAWNAKEAQVEVTYIFCAPLSAPDAARAINGISKHPVTAGIVPADGTLAFIPGAFGIPAMLQVPAPSPRR